MELDAACCSIVDDDGLEALLSVRSLRRVCVWQLELRRSHAHRPCAWEELDLRFLDVDSVARLPLEGIQRLRWCGDGICPSRNAQAVARAAAAVQRSGGLGADRSIRFDGTDPAALLATLRPLLEALPAEQQRRVTIARVGVAATPEMVQQLGQQLPPTVHTLHLSSCSLAREACAAVLPSLPATVARLELHAAWHTQARREEHVLALCAGAVRPITLVVRYMPAEEQDGIRAQLAHQADTHVTLLFE